MRILIAGHESPLIDQVARTLSHGHDVSVIDTAISGQDLLDVDRARSVVAGHQVVIFAPAPITDASDGHAIHSAAGAIFTLITAADALQRFILLGSLSIFDTCPADWRVNEDWRPRPTSALADLVFTASETVVREMSRVLAFAGICLRLGHITNGPDEVDPAAVDITDAVRAVRLAVDFQPPGNDRLPGWWPFHIAGGGSSNRYTAGSDTTRKLGYVPEHDRTGGLRAAARQHPEPPPRSVPSAPIRRAVVFGAFGPLGSAFVDVMQTLAPDVELLLTDVVPLQEAMQRAPFNRGAPVPHAVAEQHRLAVVDVRDYEQVWQATEGMDAIINLTAGRRSPAIGFGVNSVGTYHIMRAAVDRGIRRVVHTGPEDLSSAGEGRSQAGHWPDFQIPADAPSRASTSVYFLSKRIGSQIVRILAEEADLEVPALFYGNFRNPADADDDILDGFPICVSWRDGADAIARALTVPSPLPAYEAMCIVADLPQDKVRNDVAKRRLGWQPRDSFERFWTRGKDRRTHA